MLRLDGAVTSPYGTGRDERMTYDYDVSKIYEVFQIVQRPARNYGYTNSCISWG